MAVIENAAGRFDNNHMAWDYAHWLVDFAEQNVPPKDILQSYWTRSTSWISTHITDFSAFSFRQKLIKRLIHHTDVLDATFKRNTADSCKEFPECDFQFEFSLIVKEMAENENSIHFYVDHETLWHYRRFLYYVFIEILPPKMAQKWCKATLVTIDRSFLTYTSMNNDERFTQSHNKWLKDFGILIDNKS